MGIGDVAAWAAIAVAAVAGLVKFAKAFRAEWGFLTRIVDWTTQRIMPPACGIVIGYNSANAWKSFGDYIVVGALLVLAAYFIAQGMVLIHAYNERSSGDKPD